MIELKDDWSTRKYMVHKKITKRMLREVQKIEEQCDYLVKTIKGMDYLLYKLDIGKGFHLNYKVTEVRRDRLYKLKKVYAINERRYPTGCWIQLDDARAEKLKKKQDLRFKAYCRYYGAMSE